MKLKWKGEKVLLVFLLYFFFLNTTEMVCKMFIFILIVICSLMFREFFSLDNQIVEYLFTEKW